VWHVATARALKATVFLSFDPNPRKRVAAAGLTVGPER
jgi:hypothetical protein